MNEEMQQLYVFYTETGAKVDLDKYDVYFSRTEDQAEDDWHDFVFYDASTKQVIDLAKLSMLHTIKDKPQHLYAAKSVAVKLRNKDVYLDEKCTILLDLKSKDFPELANKEQVSTKNLLSLEKKVKKLKKL